MQHIDVLTRATTPVNNCGGIWRGAGECVKSTGLVDRFLRDADSIDAISRVTKSNINRTFSFPLDCFTGRVFYYTIYILYIRTYAIMYAIRESPNPITSSLSFSVRILSISHCVSDEFILFFFPNSLKNLLLDIQTYDDFLTNINVKKKTIIDVDTTKTLIILNLCSIRCITPVPRGKHDYSYLIFYFYFLLNGIQLQILWTSMVIIIFYSYVRFRRDKYDNRSSNTNQQLLLL